MSGVFVCTLCIVDGVYIEWQSHRDKMGGIAVGVGRDMRAGLVS